ncbi:DnaB helicase C-terminal domain-containing protein [Sporosarcina pasteurii]|uniref:Replicative DNA helicase n=2 Tax=Sporosarcina pasteurii TaxID=1474 RepID=A0A380CFV1_SPOPA|nr:DnaB helicase C-terminal domain-containing protein [Sporosarcina pasteurii]QBQ06939.1 DNA helicase [Sporosarcina pasteurii]SUJ18466.1 Replicative DNA helicase [Sporosarcina pasteurii]
MMDPAALGGANYLADLTSFASPTKFDSYVEMMLEEWKNREKNKILFQAKEGGWEIGAIQKAFEDLEKEGSAGMETSIQADLIRMAERPFEPMAHVPGVSTGLNALDKLLDGFQPAELIIIAARPSMGKTDTLNHFALHAGVAGYKPIIFSLEMSKVSMIDRLIAVTGRYNRLRMRDPYQHFTEKQKSNWMPTLSELATTNIHIDDRAGLKVSQMRSTARKIINTDPHLKPIIFIDYLQIIQGEYPKNNRTEVVGQISNDLKQMAKEFNCPVVCLSQLNRGVEVRDDKRPVMSDLRDSGNIEQDADVIGFLYRDDYYDKDTEKPNVLEINIAKHRNGPTGTVAVRYVKETGVLYNIDWNAERLA